jgi:hypothetical protein
LVENNKLDSWPLAKGPRSKIGKSRLNLHGTTIAHWLFQLMSIEKLINLKKIHFNKQNIPNYSVFSFPIFFDLEEIAFETFNISTYIISLGGRPFHPSVLSSVHPSSSSPKNKMMEEEEEDDE